MALYDELEGLLGPDVVAKLPAEMQSKLSDASHLKDYYDGITDDPTPPIRQPARATPPASTVAAATADLDAIGALLDKKMGDLDTRVQAKLDEALKTRGDELFNNSVAASIRINRELGRIESRHRVDLGEELDETKLNTFINDRKAAGHTYASVTDAYEDMTREARTEKQVEDRVREKLKQRSSGDNLPGITPIDSKGPLATMMQRTKADGAGETSASKAGSALADRLRSKQAVSA